MHAWTSGRSFLRSVWRVDVEVDFGDAEDSDSDDPRNAADPVPVDPNKQWALRRLQRKTPVVCHDDIGTVSLDMLEFAMHEVSTDVQHGTHRCVFGVVLPPSISSLTGYFPHTYPRSWMYAFSFTPPTAPETEATLGFSALPLSFQTIQAAAARLSRAEAPRVAQPPEATVAGRTEESSGDDVRAIPKEHLEKGVLKVLTMAHKWGAKHTPTLGATQDPWEAWQVAREGEAPQRRVPFDVLVPEAMYRRRYNRLKEVYGKPWVEKWPEQTDPQKFVYEEVGIAAYLLCLWELERESDPEKWQPEGPSGQPRRQTFVDVGCGNGFLTYILIMEGHDGWGVDIFSRGLWRHYPQHVQECLEVCKMRPSSWVASSLDADDPPVPPDDEQLREEEEARVRAEEAAAAPAVTEEETLALFDEMGMGFYDDELDDDREGTVLNEPQDNGFGDSLKKATVSAASAAGRRPPALTAVVVGSNTSLPGSASSSPVDDDTSFLQPASGLVKEPHTSLTQHPLELEPEPEPDSASEQVDKHGFKSSDGRGRGCAAIGSGVAVDWILGNHADELTPWIPLIAARTGRDTRFWILPCCFWGFSAKFEYNGEHPVEYSRAQCAMYLKPACGYVEAAHCTGPVASVAALPLTWIVASQHRYPSWPVQDVSQLCRGHRSTPSL